MKYRFTILVLLIWSAFTLGLSPWAAAEVSQVRVARQLGVQFLPLIVMEKNKLLERHLASAGLSDTKVSHLRISGANAINDAILSGSIEFGAGGGPGLAILYSRMADAPVQIKGVAAISSVPLYLVTRSPHIKSIRDFRDTDRIAMPAGKISLQAVVMQMAAEKEFGLKEFDRFDRLAVSLPHSDAMAAFLSGAGGINNHFSAPPYQFEELKHAGVRTVLTTYDVVGDYSTNAIVLATNTFYKANPKTYRAFLAALDDAIKLISSDTHAAARTYIEVENVKSSEDEVFKMISDPKVRYTMVPINVMKFAEFLNRIGATKVKPGSWKDMFFPDIHNLPGS